MPDDKLLAAFDDCLDALAAGQAPETVLARHPALRAELAPMLRAAETVLDYAAPLTPPRHLEGANRARFLARAAALRQRQNPVQGWGRWGLWAWATANRLAVVSVVVVLVLGLSAYGVAAASTGSLPGEPLYAVKRTVEQAQLALTTDADARARLERELAERRVGEVQRLLAEGRTATVGFSGVLEAVLGNRWTVAGVAVNVNGETEIEGTPLAGLYVDIEGALLADGTVAATRVIVHGQIVSGVLQSQTVAHWQIGGVVVQVNDQTRIDGALRLGDTVTANTRRLPDGQLLALSIVLAEESEATPPAETLPGGTPTPAPSVTSGAVAATATHTSPAPTVAAASPTPSVTRAPPPSATPQPTDDDDDEDDDDGSSGPSATNTPEPDETDEPDETEEPGDDDDDGEEEDGDEGEIRWEGTLESMGAVWVVGGQRVSVNGATEVSGSPQVGDTVEVRAERQGDGSLVATRIEKK